MPPAPSTWSLKDFLRLTTASSSPSVITAVVDIRRPRILRSSVAQKRGEVGCESVGHCYWPVPCLFRMLSAVESYIHNERQTTM